MVMAIMQKDVMGEARVLSAMANTGGCRLQPGNMLRLFLPGIKEDFLPGITEAGTRNSM